MTTPPSLQNIYERLVALEELVRRHCREQDYFLILLKGINHLGYDCSGWKDKVRTLLFLADVPLAWIVDIVQDPANPNQVTIQSINYPTARIIIQRIKKIP